MVSEAFLLFSQSIPSQNLGFVDSKATVLDVSVAGRDLTIYQSPTILSSNRDGGTTGAVVWKITPLFANWITTPTNPLLKHNIVTNASSVLELGCGISGIIGLGLASFVRSYTLTDQEYVARLVNQNLDENRQVGATSSARGRKSGSKKSTTNTQQNNVKFMPLDWEQDEVLPELTGVPDSKSFDLIIACDCIYNDALVAPLVQACVDVCKLRTVDDEASPDTPTVCVIAQQLRSDEVFEAWLKKFHKSFRVWRVPDSDLIAGLREDTGFVVHAGVLR